MPLSPTFTQQTVKAKITIVCLMTNDSKPLHYDPTHTHTISSVQVREAYLQFMITIAKMIREDMNISKDDLFVQEEMAKVMKLETDIANVSTAMKDFSVRLGRRKEEESNFFFSSLTQ